MVIREFIVETERHVQWDSDFVNVKPIAERRDGQIFALSENELSQMLPDSEKQNVNIRYMWSSNEKRAEIDELFPDGGLAVVRFDPDDRTVLEDNMKKDGMRQQTGYRMFYDFLKDNNRLSTLADAGIYVALRHSVIPKEELLNSKIVRFNHDAYGMENYAFYVEFDGSWVGPFSASYNGTNARYEIQPDLALKGYVLYGYRKEQLSMAYTDVGLTLIVPKEGEKPTAIDAVQTPELLLEGLKRALSSGTETAKDTCDVLRIVAGHAENPIFGGGVPEQMRTERIERLKALLDTSDQMESILTGLGAQLLDHIGSSEAIDRWIMRYIESNPDLLATHPAMLAEQKKYAQLQSKHSALQESYEQLEVAAQNNPEQARRIQDLEKELEEAKARLAPQEELARMAEKRAQLQEELDRLHARSADAQVHKLEVDKTMAAVDQELEKFLMDKHAAMARVEYDGIIARKWTEAAAKGLEQEASENRMARWGRTDSCSSDRMEPAELISYIVDTVKMVRPTYDAPTILNAVICMTQGFLTIFSGTAGCGKTSLSNILGDVLGLNRIADAAGFPADDLYVNRYVPISVEKGWSSKRDLLGYYNPLTRTFDENDRRLYEAMLQLDHEKRADKGQFPFVILLDEANLSQMEYYWSDFMNVCDSLGNSDITLGPNLICRIPDHLRFLATINNDDTTLPLSPRLIDRSWIVTLPNVYADSLAAEALPPEKTRIVRWADLQRAFTAKNEECVLPENVAELYDSIRKEFTDTGAHVSARTDKAIRRYWGAAAKSFRMAAENPQMQDRSDIMALDFAVSQRLLPKISGSGDDMETWLAGLNEICRKGGLEHSRDIIDGVLQRGSDRMKYYTFFY